MTTHDYGECCSTDIVAPGSFVECPEPGVALFDEMPYCARHLPLCDLCLTRLKQADDVFCVECRLDCINCSDTCTDPVQHVLSSHQHFCGLSDMDSTLCLCGETFEGGPGYWRRHVAEKVYEVLGIEGPPPWLLGADSKTPDRYGIRQPKVLHIDGKRA